VHVASVCRLCVTLCIVAKQCVLKQKLLLTAYRNLYMMNRLLEPKIKKNDLDHCLEVVLMSRQLLSHIRH